MTLFSVIVPILNPPSIARLINSLQNQSVDKTQYEVIIVGLDGFGIVQSDNLVAFDETEFALSPAAARNRGAENARGDIFVFTDADCVPYPNWLSVYTELFSDPGISVIGGGVEFEEENYWTIADNISMFHDFLAFLPPGQRMLLPSLNLAIRRGVFIEVGGFDERYPIASGEDADLSLRLGQLGYELIFEPTARILHLPQRSNLTDILWHSYFQGKFSTKVDPRYGREHGIPWPIQSRLGILISSPFLAMGALMRIFTKHPNFWQYWYSIPAVLTSKLAWCVGASNHERIE